MFGVRFLTSQCYSGSGPTRDDEPPNQTASCKPSVRPNRIYASFVAENAPTGGRLPDGLEALLEYGSTARHFGPPGDRCER
jgi:hypothetical protein